MKCIFASALIAAATSAQQVVDESFLQVEEAEVGSLFFNLVANSETGRWDVPDVFIGETTKVALVDTVFALNKPHTFISATQQDLSSLSADEWVAGATGVTRCDIKGDLYTTQIGNKWSATDYGFVNMEVSLQTATDPTYNWLGFGRPETDQEDVSNYVKQLKGAYGKANSWTSSFSLGYTLESSVHGVQLNIGSKNIKLFKAQPEGQPTETNAYAKDSTSYATELVSMSTVVVNADGTFGTKSEITATAKTAEFAGLTDSLSLPKADLSTLATALGFTGTNNSSTMGCSSMDNPNLEIKVGEATLVLPPSLYTQNGSPNCLLKIAEADGDAVILGGQLLQDFYVTFSDDGIQFEVGAHAPEGTLVTYGGASLLTAAAGIFAAVTLAL